MDSTETINQFLVKTFNALRRQEEAALTTSDYRNLSINEFHVIEAVADACTPGGDNSMSSLSQTLGITTGSLTVAVKTLEQKGYLRRERSPYDKRRVQVLLTELGQQANSFHRQFHWRMVATIRMLLNPDQLDALADTMRILTDFFGQGGTLLPSDCGTV